MSKNKSPKNNVFYRNQNWHYPKVTHGKGIFLYDDTGKEYIDGCSGSAVANIGHGNEEIANITAEQIKKIAFIHLSRFTHDPIEKASELIAQLTPGDLNHVYAMSGGSEATETAIKMARQYYVERDKNTSKSIIISKFPSFHGNTLGALSMTGITERRRIYNPMLLQFPKINQFYCYRCPYKSTPDKCDLQCAYELQKTIDFYGKENISAFISEPIVGASAPGINPPKEYFKIIRDICDKNDILFIMDEVMAGLRTGKAFGALHYDVVPDIMCIAKGFSSGYSPYGAAIANEKVHNQIMIQGSGVFIHGHTYGGNPLSSEIVRAVLTIIKRENIVENARIQGEYLLNKMQDLYKYPIVGDIRGKGLMIGIEFVKNQKTKEPFEKAENIKGKITTNCLDEGLVVYPGGGTVDGVRGDHILIAPPLNITQDEIDQLFERLELGIKKTSEGIN